MAFFFFKAKYKAKLIKTGIKMCGFAYLDMDNAQKEVVAKNAEIIPIYLFLNNSFE